MRQTTPLALLLIATSLSPLQAAEPLKADFNTHIKPILESACVHCHSEKNAKGKLRIETKELMLKGGENGAALVPGDPDKSPLTKSIALAADDDDVMPPKKEGLLSKEQIALLKDWVKQGAPWPDGVVLQQQTRVDFVKHVQPILEQNCVSCHNPEKAKGKWDISTKEKAFATGENKPNIVPFDTAKCALYSRTVLAADDEDLMPPKKSGGPLSKAETEILRNWVAQGAAWPEGITLKAKEKKAAATNTPDTLDLVKRIRDFIIATQKEKGEADMKNYDSKIPKTGAPYHMVVIKGGEFMLGSPASEDKRGEDEGPQVKVKVKPFWMSAYETTWDEYQPYMINTTDRNKDGSPKIWKAGDKIDNLVSQPTTPYTEMSFGMGTDGYPAISMTQHAANKYCEWLSAQTGHYYRLPTEAEWEYAARAGSTTAYFFGNDPAQLKDYAWYFENAENFQYSKVGKKKPNPWGLYDIYGNVVEWCLDQYDAGTYANWAAQVKGGALDGSTWVHSKTPYPHSVRGGSYDDDPDMCRSAFRRGSEPAWKAQDPQLPKSIWYHTDAKWLGFRIIRPLEIPSAEEMFAAWNNGVAKDQ